MRELKLNMGVDIRIHICRICPNKRAEPRRSFASDLLSDLRLVFLSSAAL